MPRGYTLIEVIVVLVLMALAVTLVAPALIARRDAAPALAALVGQSRATAIRRAEAVYLRIEASGAWRMDGAASSQVDAIATGRVTPAPAAPLTLVFSPLGSCAPDVATAPAAEALGLDPLTCEATP